MVHSNSAGKCLPHTNQLIITTLILGWNTLQVSIYLYYNKLLTFCNFQSNGTEQVIYSIQIDLHHFFKQLQLVLHITHWHSQYHRPKPPWHNRLDGRKINLVFIGIIIRIIANKNKFFTLHPFVLHDLSTFIVCSLLHILIFHTELNFCSIRMILGLLIVENIDIPYHNHKRSCLFLKICRSQGIIRSSTHLHSSVHKPPWLYSHTPMQKDVQFEILEDADLLTQTDHE